jgi:DNA polymerase
MSLDIDKRRRAMLREMGVRVWQPLPPEALPVVAATEVIAADVRVKSASGHFEPQVQEKAAAPAPLAPTPARPAAPSVAAPVTRPAASAPASGQAAWQVGDVQTLYAATARAGGARWLVLAETPASALGSPVFDGDAGRLLGNMLRAARLDRAGAVLLAPLVRRAASVETQVLSADLAALLAHARPDIVLVMGRLAAQAVLQTSQPLGKLRGEVHRLHGIPTVVTYDAPYLLRIPADKARAWDDLCLAMGLAAPAAPAASA